MENLESKKYKNITEREYYETKDRYEKLVEILNRNREDRDYSDYIRKQTTPLFCYMKDLERELKGKDIEVEPIPMYARELRDILNSNPEKYDHLKINVYMGGKFREISHVVAAIFEGTKDGNLTLIEIPKE